MAANTAAAAALPVPWGTGIKGGVVYQFNKICNLFFFVMIGIRSLVYNKNKIKNLHTSFS